MARHSLHLAILLALPTSTIRADELTVLTAESARKAVKMNAPRLRAAWVSPARYLRGWTCA